MRIEINGWKKHILPTLKNIIVDRQNPFVIVKFYQ